MNKGFQPDIVDAFGGLCTRIDRADLPKGLSPNCVNVEFFPGGYQSRVGYVPVATDASQGFVNGIGSFITTAGVRQRLYLYFLGELHYATGTSSESQVTIEKIQIEQQMKAVSLYNRIYMAFSTKLLADSFTPGTLPSAHPRQWDGTNLDVVAQGGVPAVPTGAVDAGTGTKCTVGTHYFTMVCETRSGALLQPAKSSSIIVIGLATDRYKWTSIPLGPPNTTRRRIYMTQAVVNGDATQYFTLPKLWINDNTTTGPFYADVADIELAAGEPLTGDSAKGLPDLSATISMPPCLSLGTYSDRLIFMGPMNSVGHQVVPNTKDGLGNNNIVGADLGYVNLELQAGSSAGVPYGWTQQGAYLGNLVTGSGASVQAYEITCDGGTYVATPYRGELRNTYTATGTAADYTQGNTYNVRVRAKKTSGFTGNIIVGIVGGTTVTIAAGSMGTNDYAWYELGNPFGATVAGQLFFGVSGVTTNGEKATIDAIEVYLAQSQILASRAWVSQWKNPECVDALTGAVDVNPGDGQKLMCGFELGGSYYWVKEKSLWRSSDNGLEPALWDGPNEVSPIVGSPSIHGVGTGVRWVIIVGDQGVFKFDGGEPELVSDEIRPTLQRVNWLYGYKMWCVVDPEGQLVKIGLPIDGSTEVNSMLTLDYSGGWDSAMGNPGFGRKWTFTMHPNVLGSSTDGFRCAARVESGDAKRYVVFGGGTAGRGCVVRRDPTGAAIVDNFGNGNVTLTSTYETATLGDDLGRSFFGGVVVKASGVGTLQPYLVRPGGTAVALVGAGLSSSNHDLEFKSRGPADTQTGVRLVVGATDNVGTGQGSIRVKRVGLFRKPAVTSRFRGKNTPA